LPGREREEEENKRVGEQVWERMFGKNETYPPALATTKSFFSPLISRSTELPDCIVGLVSI
jgi:hypothetical protein